MGGKTVVYSLALLMLAASSSPTINPSSTTISSTIYPSSTSSSNHPSSSAISQTDATPSVTIKPLVASSEFGFLSPKPSSSYQVTENVVDIPDDRTISPNIIPNYGLVKPLNVANASINVNKVTKNDTGDENSQLKRTTFTFVHITKDTEDKKEGGIKNLFKGIKDYVYNLKKGVVDSLHNYFHKDDKNEYFNTKFHRSYEDSKKNDDKVDFYHKFHRNIHSDENFDDYEYDDDEFKDGTAELDD